MRTHHIYLCESISAFRFPGAENSKGLKQQEKCLIAHGWKSPGSEGAQFIWIQGSDDIIRPWFPGSAFWSWLHSPCGQDMAAVPMVWSSQNSQSNSLSQPFSQHFQQMTYCFWLALLGSGAHAWTNLFGGNGRWERDALIGLGLNHMMCLCWGWSQPQGLGRSHPFKGVSVYVKG